MTPPVLIEPPAVLPVELAALKRHLRIDADVTEDDVELTDKIEAATKALDGYSGLLGRCLITQKWAIDTGCQYSASYRLPLFPISDVAITYRDETGAEQELPDAYSRLVQDAAGARVELSMGYSWPATQSGGTGLSIALTAGYGDSPADVPADIRLAIMLAVEMSRDRPDGSYFDKLEKQYNDIVNRNRRGMI